MTLILDALPLEVEKLHADLKAAVARHRDLKCKAVEAAAAEPIAARALEAARVALDSAEVDFALATDENDKEARAALASKRGELQEAEEGLRFVQLLGRGLKTRTETAADAILTARVAFDTGAPPFCQGTLAAYRQLLRGAVIGPKGLPLARVLQVGHALLDALPFSGKLRQILGEISVPDIGPVPGRPVPRLIQGERVWPDDDLAGASLRQWQNDAEIVALHTLLKPLGAVYAEATALIRRIEADRARAPAPPVPADRPQPRAVSGEEFLASQPSAEEHRAIMQAAHKARAEKFGAKPPVEHSYHGSRFANDQLA